MHLACNELECPEDASKPQAGAAKPSLVLGFFRIDEHHHATDLAVRCPPDVW